jgi:starch phosphorylase
VEPAVRLADARVAYLSMEIGLSPRMPTYAGGLGILAGDTIRSSADLHVPMVALTLLHRKGYFRQRLDAAGTQFEDADDWKVEELLVELAVRVEVTIEGRRVRLRAWRRDVMGITGGAVPVIFLDTDLPENGDADRALTDYLYGGDERYRLAQEVVLGMGGLKMLRALGCAGIERFHMNEGHASLLALELLNERVQMRAGGGVRPDDVAAVRERCVFTTHTPVPSGHDQFPMELARRVMGDSFLSGVENLCCFGGALNLTYMALNFSRHVNGVAMTHGEESRRLFGGYTIDAVTNGVHAATWACPEMQELFDRYIPGWRTDSFSLRYALKIPDEAIRAAHLRARARLIDLARAQGGTDLGHEAFTIGFARRATPYKRADLLLQDLARLRSIRRTAGPFQVIYAGKAHPRDGGGRDVIRRVFAAARALGGEVPVVYLADYDMELAGAMTAGVDLWLNTPQPPLEASGTSGMKAAINGVPSLSVLDGWWVEGHIEGVTGWAIDGANGDAASDAASLYDKLERVILPLYHTRPAAYVDVMRQAIALNGSFFNSERMVQEYLAKVYGRVR